MRTARDRTGNALPKEKREKILPGSRSGGGFEAVPDLTCEIVPKFRGHKKRTGGPFTDNITLFRLTLQCIKALKFGAELCNNCQWINPGSGDRIKTAQETDLKPKEIDSVKKRIRERTREEGLRQH